MRVILSVHDKTGLVELAAGLVDLGHELVASGGTAAALAAAGIAHRDVESVTGAPEILGGRVKTLHPAIHGGILADLGDPGHVAELGALGVEPVGLVVCNLYPFLSSPSIEMIDIGGVALLRAAAKNHANVGVISAPADYATVLAELRARGQLSAGLRRRLAAAAFARTAAYDAAIADWFAARAQAAEEDDRAQASGEDDQEAEQRTSLPATIHLSLERARVLRYGENPHQAGALYAEVGRGGWLGQLRQHGGMELSYLNLYDADAAWRLVHAIADLGPAAAVVVKHANPCGVAVADELRSAYEAAFGADPVAAFGGIVALSAPVDGDLARELVANPKADVLVAPAYSAEALSVFESHRKNMRVLEAPAPTPAGWQLRQLGGGWLVQDPPRLAAGRGAWRVVTSAVPTGRQWADLELAWRVVAAVKSNAVVVAAGGVAVGIGGGQQSRVAAAELAVARAAGRGAGGAAASDAFFPFRDGLDALVASGVAAVVQPGGSVRDPEVVAAADEHGIAMVLTGERQFLH